ncbi:MAG: Rdx family protein [Chloroflexota bacterium]
MQQPMLDVKITYCAPCGFTERVMNTTSEILGEREIEHYVGNWTLVPSSGSVFEVEVNGELVFSKKTLGRHAEPGEVRAAVLAKLNQVRTVQIE